MHSRGSTKQEQDLLHQTARTFMHHLCRARRYCHEVGPCAEALHAQVERLVQQAGSQADASVALYYFNASLYLLRVLKGNTNKRHQDGHKLHGADTEDSEVSQGQPCSRLSLSLLPAPSLTPALSPGPGC